MDRSLRRAVLERLAAVEAMAVRTGSHLSVRTARTHLKTITGGWRELLLEHQPDQTGRCPVCSGWLRRRRWPCQVWVTAHHHLIGDGPEPATGPIPKPGPFRRPRRVEVIPRQPGAAEHTRTEHTRTEHTRTEHTRNEQARTEQDEEPGTGGGAAERFAGPAPRFAAGGPGTDGMEIHRAAITGREPTLPRSRQGWRARA